MSVRSKVRLYNAYVSPVLMYAIETRAENALTKQQKCEQYNYRLYLIRPVEKERNMRNAGRNIIGKEREEIV